MKDSMRRLKVTPSCFKALLVMFFCISVVACSSCEQHNESRSHHQASSSDESRCVKVGERCRIRKGVLGVCLPGAPASDHKTPLVTAENRLICTPQH